jgi:hypothetical protein
LDLNRSWCQLSGLSNKVPGGEGSWHPADNFFNPIPNHLAPHIRRQGFALVNFAGLDKPHTGISLVPIPHSAQ